MAYRIKRKERVGKAIRRILREQLRRAIEARAIATASRKSACMTSGRGSSVRARRWS